MSYDVLKDEDRRVAQFCMAHLEYAAQQFRVCAALLRRHGDEAEAQHCERDAVRVMTPVYIVRRP
jgi:hypothetical protein